jgi:hypothetical protein
MDVQVARGILTLIDAKKGTAWDIVNPEGEKLAHNKSNIASKNSAKAQKKSDKVVARFERVNFTKMEQNAIRLTKLMINE